MAVYPVASSSSVYYPSSSTSSAYYYPSSSVKSSSSYVEKDYYTSSSSAMKGVLTKTPTSYTTICKTATVSGKPVTYTTVYDLLNSCFPTVTVTKTVVGSYATPVAAAATSLPYKPVASEYAAYGESCMNNSAKRIEF
jgi:hypothetical protein